MTVYAIYINGEDRPITCAQGIKQRDKVLTFYRKAKIPVVAKVVK